MRRSRKIPAFLRHGERPLLQKLEPRLLLSGVYEQQLINAVSAALAPGSATGLSAFNSDLRDSSALGRSLPVIGTGLTNPSIIGSYDAGAAISGLLAHLSGSYSSLSGLASGLANITGITVSATRDLPNVIELDVQWKATTTATVPISANFGVPFSTTSNATLTVNLTEQLTIGAYWNGAAAISYVNASNASIVVAATLTGVSAPGTAGSTLGFIALHGGITAAILTPTFTFSLNPQPPVDGYEPAGTLTFGQLTTVPISQLVSTQVTQASASTATASISTALAPSASTIVFTWPDINTPNTVSSTLPTDPTLATLNQLQTISPATFTLGLDELTGDIAAAADAGSNVLQTNLPIIGESISTLIGFPTFVSKYLTQYTDATINSSGIASEPFQTDAQFKNLMANDMGLNGFGVANPVTETASGSRIIYTLELAEQINVAVPLALGVDSQLTGFDPGGTVAVNAMCDMYLQFGVDASTETFFAVPTAQPTFAATVSILQPTSMVNSAANIGFLAVQVSNGTLTMNASATIALQDPQTDIPPTPGIITANELSSANLPTLATVALAGTASGMFPLTLPSGNFYVSGIAPAALAINWGDLTEPTNFTLNTATVQQYLGFNNFTSANMLGYLNDLPGQLNNLSDSAGLGTPLAFLGAGLGSVVDIGPALQTNLSTLNATTADNMEDLVKALQLALAPAGDSVTVMVTASDIEFAFSLSQSYSGPENWSLAASLGAGSVEFQAAGTVPIVASINAAVDYGISLTTQANPTDQAYIIEGSGSKVNAHVQVGGGAITATALTLGTLDNLGLSSASASVTASGGGAATILLPLGGAPSGQLTLTQLMATPDALFGTPTINGVAHVTLGLTGLPAPGSNPSVALSWTNLATPASVTVTPTNLGPLGSASSFNAKPFLDGIGAILALVNNWNTSSIFSTNIPFINQPISSVLNFVGDAQKLLMQIQSGGTGAASGTALESAVLGAAAAAGLNPSTITQGASDNASMGVFDYVLSFNESAMKSFAFGLGGSSSLFSLSTTVTMSAAFTTNIEFGFDPADGFYVVGNTNTSTPQVSLTGSINATFPQIGGSFGPVTIGVHNGTASLSLALGLNLIPSGDNGNKIAGAELAANAASILKPSITGSGSIYLPIGFYLGQGGPGATTTFSANWNPDRAQPLEFGSAASPSINPVDGFGSIYFDLGEYVSDLVGPVLKQIKAFNPLPQSIVNVLNYNIPLINKTPLDLLEQYLGGGTSSTTDEAFNLLLGISSVLNDLPSGAGQINLHSYMSSAPATNDSGTVNGASDGSGEWTQFNDFVNMLSSQYDITLPAVQNPVQSIIDTLLGQSVTLVEFNPGYISLSASYETPQITVPLYSIGIATISGFISAGLSATLFANLDIGLSTRGLIGNYIGGTPGTPGPLIDGFFINDSQTYQVGLKMEGHITIGGELDIGPFNVAEIYGQAGPYGIIGVHVNDVYYNKTTGVPEGIADYNGAPAGDNMAYLDEIGYIASNFGPFCAIMPLGELGLQITCAAQISLPIIGNITIFSWTLDIPFANFDYPCTPVQATLAQVQGNSLVMLNNDASTAAHTISASIHYNDTTGLPDGVRITKSDSSSIVYQDFSFAALAGVNTIVLQGTAGDDTFSADPLLTIPIPTQSYAGIQYLTVNSGPGNDKADFSNFTTLNSMLLGLTINGGNGNDDFTGNYAYGMFALGTGKNRLFTGTGNALVNETSGTDQLQGGNGNIVVNAGSGTESMLFGNGNNIINGGSGTYNIVLGDGNNVVNAGSGTETMVLGNGQNLVTAGTGTDTINAGDGNNKIYGDLGGSSITVGAGQDILYGGPGNDTITAGGGNDFINPGTGNDTVDGGTGRTLLAVSADANQTLTNKSVILNGGALGTISFTDIHSVSLSGGPGNNVFDVSAWTGVPAVQINGGGGSDTVASTDNTNFTLTDDSLQRSDGARFALNGIATADLTGGSSNNTFDVTGWHGGGIMNGNGGVDTLIADNVSGATLTNTTLQRSGTANLTMANIGQVSLTTVLRGGVTINADAFTGQLALFGEGNNNLLIGGTGSDYILGGSGTGNTLVGNGATNNQILGGSGASDTLDGGGAGSVNMLVGSAGGADLITGGAGASHIYTPGNGDTVNVQAGHAIVYAAGTGETVNIGGSTTDQVMHPGDAGTVPSDFTAPEAVPWIFPQLPAVNDLGIVSTLPTGPASQGQWVEYANSASGGGLSDTSAGAIEPSIVATGSGSTAAEFVAWADDRTGTYEIYVAEHTIAGGWQQLAGSAQGGGISNSNVDSGRPSITLDASGNPIVAWTEINGASTDIYAARFNPTANGGQGGWIALGDSLGAGGGLSNLGTADKAQVVYTATGPVVAWLDNTNSLAAGSTNVYLSTFNGTNWNPVAPGSATGGGISNSSSLISSFSLATDGSKLAVAWTQTGTADGGAIYVSQYAGSTWSGLNGSASGNGISGAFNASMPSAAFDGGALYVAWSAITNGAANIVAATNAGSGWNAVSIDTPASAGINQVSRGAATDPVLSSNGGALNLVWIEDRLPGTPDQAVAIYANRLQGSSFVRQLPGDASFDGILQHSTALSQPATLALAVDAAGNPYVAWGDGSSGSSQIYTLADTLSVHQVIYVNDALTVTDSYTTAGGSPTANGLTPATPLNSIQAALNLALLAPGDVILVDSGHYAGFNANAADNGVLIVGSPGGETDITGNVNLNSVTGMTLDELELGGGTTVSGGSAIEFANVIGGTPHQLANGDGAGITLSGPTGVTLDDDALAGLTLTGTTASIVVFDSTILGQGVAVNGPSTGLLMYGNLLKSLSLDSAAQGTITGNDISGGGLAINATFTGSIDHNLIHGASVGVTYGVAASLNANEIFDNHTGVAAVGIGGTGGLGFVPGSVPNQIVANDIGVNLTGQMQQQDISGNDIGVTGSGVLGGTSLVDGNLIEDNRTGVNFVGAVQANRIDQNGIAIVAQNHQLITGNLIYNNVGPNLETAGATDVRIINNTFYSATGTNIAIDGGSSNVQVLDNILWTGGGYDLNVADNSRSGFFSDYNDLYATGAGVIVHYLIDFKDILDWQDDVALFDLHSIGVTVVNPTWAQPEFVDLALGDLRVFPTAAGLRYTSPTIATADPAIDLGVPASYQNLLANPSFENGLTGWSVNPGGTTASGSPAAFDGSSYFFAGSVASGFAQQTISLLSVGYTTAQLDAGNLDLSFGGRIQSALEGIPDQGQLVLTFLDGGGNVIGAPDVVSATNVNGRWELVGDRLHIPVGARSFTYRYQSFRESGSTDDSFLDGAFAYVLLNTVATSMGAYGNTTESAAMTEDEKIQLKTPDLYVNWTLTQSHQILWSTFGNTGGAPVEIQLYQNTVNGPQYLLTITPSTADSGAYAWIPQDSGLTYGTYGLRIEVSLVGDAAVHDLSTESFTIPENGSSYYINDGSTVNDQYTTAAGNNRATGKLASAPLPLLTTLLRTYSLGATDTVYVDNGTYQDFAAVGLSGNPALGSGQGVTILGPTGLGQAATIDALGFTSPAVIDVNDAAFVTIRNIGVSGGNYGLWIHNASTNFVGSYLTSSNNLLGGIRIESDSTGSTFDHLTIFGNGGDGLFSGGPLVSITNSLSFDNTGDGFDLPNAGNAVLTDDSAYGDNIGLNIANSTASTATTVGNTNLSLNLGNTFFNNSIYGINASGNSGYASMLIAGNVVYGQNSVTGDAGINLTGGVTVTEDIVYSNYDGIRTNSFASLISNNRVFNNSDVGIEADDGATATGNDVYSNGVGIRSSTAPNTGTGPYLTNNLVYANATKGIWLIGGNASRIDDNTVYQITGDALHIDAYGGILASGIQVENNILWTSGGYDITLDPTSENGFKSDYNDLYVTGTGKIGLWENIAQATLGAWRSASAHDVNSISLDPLFVNPAGADGQLGYVNGADHGTDDDFHVQSTTGSFHGGSLAPVLNSGTGLPMANPGTQTADANESPAIDRGDASFAYANEPSPNGGYINLGAYGNTGQASISPVSYVLVLQPQPGNTLVEGQGFTITWRSQDSSGTVNIDLVQGNNQVVLAIAAGVSNNGSFLWTIPTSLTPGNYQIRVTRNAAPTAVGFSGVITLNAPTTIFYVNGPTVYAGDVTTAPGNDANSGLDPADPKASIQSVLTSYTMSPGDEIYVDHGTYNLSSNIILTAADSGIIIDGIGALTILDRTNLATGSYVFDLQGATNVTLENLAITGGDIGINASASAGSTGLTVSNSFLYGSQDYAINLSAGNAGALITGNQIHDLLGTFAQAGVSISNDQVTVTNNTVYNDNAYGIQVAGVLGTPATTISGNTVYSNSIGIAASNATVSGNIAYGNWSAGISVSNTSTVTGNTTYNNLNTKTNSGPQIGIQLYGGTASGNISYGNAYGISFYGDATASNNLIYNNTTAGISGGNGSNILGNVLYGNLLGITANSNPSAADGGPVIENNLLYNNTSGGIYLAGGDHTPILNNTIYQIAGIALQLAFGSQTTNAVTVRNNILWDTAGADINVAPGAEPGVTFDYNDLYFTGTGEAGVWGSTTAPTLAAWQSDSNNDSDSISTDPLFVNAATGDFHLQSLTGSFHGGSLAPILNVGTGLPQANPGTLTADVSESPAIDRGAPTDPYANELSPNGGYVNLGAYGNTSQASLSPAHYLFVINPQAGQTVATGQPVTISWRDEVSNIAAGASDTVQINVFPLGNPTPAQSFTGPDIGHYLWTPPSSLLAGTYTISITRTDGTGLVASSNPFNIAFSTGIYYVNGSATGGTFTTAGGNNANTGLDPAHPKATIAAIFAAYTLQPGNIIEVDSGTYNLPSNLTLTAADDGITIEGVPGGGTILNRGNLTAGAYVFDFQGALNVTLQNLAITGALYGINVNYSQTSNGLTVTGCNFYGDENIGIYLGGNNGMATITNNTFHDMLGVNGIYGFESYSYANEITLTGNTAYNLGYGLAVTVSNTVTAGSIISNNTVYDNNVGIDAGNGSNLPFIVSNNIAYDNYTYNLDVGGGLLTATGNTVYEDGGAGIKESSSEIGIIMSNGAVVRSNIIHGNVIGIDTTGGTTASGNQVYNNTSYGIEATTNDLITGNLVYGNGKWGIFGAPLTVSGNLVYGNTSGGIYLTNDYDASVLSNTVYQTTGNAFRLDGLRQNGNSPPSIILQNNILWTTSAPDLLIDDAGEASFSTPTSDYNDLYATGTGEIAQMAGQNFPTLSAWAWELGLDIHSISANPLFVNAGVGNFHVQSASPTIDAGNPASEFISEPNPNGGRINLGYDGNTPQAATSPATTVQVTSPTSLQKLQVGQPTTINWLSTGLLSTQTITEVAAGESAAIGEYHPAEFQVGSQTTTSNNATINTTLVTNPAPLAVYQTYAQANSVIGSYLAYLIPVPDGTYTIRLDFVEPYVSSVGGRTFDILLQGQTVQAAFDIYSAAGKAINKAVALTFTVTASGGSGISLQLKSDTANPALLNGFELSMANPGGTASPTANIQASTDNGATWTTIASSQPMDAEGRGSFVWTPTTQTTGSTAMVRVVANNAAATTGVSPAFPIANAGTAYYVSNSTTTAGNQYTTALGNNANSGTSPASPMTSIEAVLNDYHPGAGDTIYVDNGTYNLFHNINIPMVDTGVTIQGPTVSGAAAVLNRGNNSASDYVFSFFDGANNVTLENLSITGAYVGINAPYKVTLGNNGITIGNNQIYSNADAGILTGFNLNWTITGNVIHDNFAPTDQNSGIYLQATSATITNNTIYNESTYGIAFSPPSGALVSANVVSGNTVYGDGIGIYVHQATVSGNFAHDNSTIGIYADDGSVVTRNTVWRQTATNAAGIYVAAAFVTNNAAFGNYIGILANGGEGVTINANRIYSNTNYGLFIENVNGSAYSNGPGYVVTAYSNLIYANSTGGISISGTNYDLSLLNNTVYQLVGDAINLSGPTTATYPITIENNILWAQAGYDLDITSSSSQAGLISDDNILYHIGANANVGTWWTGTTEASLANLAAWQAASSLDAHSSEANPQFVDPTGADAVLGYNATAQNGNGYDGGGDDNFFVLAGSPAIGTGKATFAPPVFAPAADLLGYPFHSDIGAYAYRGTTTTPPTVTSATLAAGQITVIFSQTPNDVDAGAPSLYVLRGAGPDGVFGTSDDVVYSLTPAYQRGTNEVILTINGGPLPPGLFQLTIHSNANSSVHNLAGVALDGNSDGTPGGDYVTTFTVSPPEVTNVYVSGTAWTQSFLNYLATSAQGSAMFGYSLPGLNQLHILPAVNLNQISIQFSENVNLTSAALSITGVNQPNYSISLFSYNPSDYVATWTLSSVLPADHFLLDLHSAAVTDATGEQLDGEWVDAVSTISGNGRPGGDFLFHFNVLPADANGDGTVNAADFTALSNHFGQANAGFGGGDFNGDGVTNFADFAALSNSLGDSLAPVITQVYVSGTAWTQSFLNYLTTSGQGSATLGYLLQGPNQLQNIAASNVNEISIQFSENVSITSADLSILGVNQPSYAISLFSYNPADRVATWTLSSVLPADRFLLALNSAAVTGAGGTQLDGAWVDGVSTISGDGTPGSEFQFHFNVLPGDANGDGVVNGADFTLLSNHVGQANAGFGGGDFNGDDVTNFADFAVLSNSFGATLPAIPAASPADSTALTAGIMSAEPNTSVIAAPAGTTPQIAPTGATLTAVIPAGRGLQFIPTRLVQGRDMAIDATTRPRIALLPPVAGNVLSSAKNIAPMMVLPPSAPLSPSPLHRADAARTGGPAVAATIAVPAAGWLRQPIGGGYSVGWHEAATQPSKRLGLIDTETL